MRDTVFGLLRTCPQRCFSLLPTSPPGTLESAYHSKDHYQYYSKNSGWAGPTRCFQISCFCSPSAVNSQVWSKNSGWGVNFEKLLNMILTIPGSSTRQTGLFAAFCQLLCNLMQTNSEGYFLFSLVVMNACSLLNIYVPKLIILSSSSFYLPFQFRF